MTTEHITLFSGSSIIINGLQIRLEENKISSIIKDRVESARLGGFGEHRTAIELLIFKSDLAKALPILEKYKEEINS